jgi:hypothetical protein
MTWLWQGMGIAMDRSTIAPFLLLVDGNIYEADILVKARSRWQESYFIIHIEHQSIFDANFDRLKREEFSARFAAITECDQGFSLKREGLILSHCANYIIHHAIASNEKNLALVSRQLLNAIKGLAWSEKVWSSRVARIT